MVLVTLVALAVSADPTFCGETPTKGASASIGRTAKGRLEGGVAVKESAALRVLPARHRRRCLAWGTARLVAALERAGAAVQRAEAGAPPLGVGNLGRARGGSLAPYSHSHQAGRDADLAFYATTAAGQPVAAEDLTHFGADLRSPDGDLRFDVKRNWALVAALLSDGSIDVRWLFVSEPLRKALLDEGRRRGASSSVLERAEAALHQPSDAPPHDDHFHLRIRCTAQERKNGCHD
jgi:penicillin-insensitive murein endopeptidase